MNFFDVLSLSWRNLKSNKLRTSITVIIIALGIFALILIITAIKAASNSLTSSFSTMGANSFSIRYRSWVIRFGDGKEESNKSSKSNTKRDRKSNIGIPINYYEALAFKAQYKFPGASVALAINGPSGIVVNNSSFKTNPEIKLFGGDENYVSMDGSEILEGRNFSPAEITSGANVCLLGYSVASTLFPKNISKGLETIIHVDHQPFRVIGVLKKKSSSAFFSSGTVVIMPYNNLRKNFKTSASFLIGVTVRDVKLLNMAASEAEGVFRPIRKLDIRDEDNFFIDKSDSIAQVLLSNLSFLEIASIGIAFITLMGAAIGLMNIMLVAVNERTKEIGLVKALGGTKSDIRHQFLFESIIISLLGAGTGIVLGVLIGNVVALLLNTGFVLPWNWIFAGIGVCTVVGLVAGLYPAVKASKLDPIVALRYE
ncbi:MAG: ABC transporter permease [Ferruginibacter sp.]|nr:ABC transporter permease [Ferruginibacter sp.]